jgi:3-oxoacyl-[acyl-carrier protein] reductase
LAAAGADVIVHGRAASDRAAAVIEKVRQSGQSAHFVPADLAVASAPTELVSACLGWRGHVDIWVNNAGADVLTGPAAQWTFEQKLERLWRVDVLGTVALSRLIGPHMAQRTEGGAIVNIGWDQAVQGMGGDSGEMFSTAKGAVMAFSRSLAQSLAPRVRVNCVAPGWIRTAWGETASTYWQDRARRDALRGRWGEPEDVARMVRFLASPEADFITGQIINVNGGFRYSHDPE